VFFQGLSGPLSAGAMTLFSFVGAMLIAASSSAVTPLYRLYQQSMHLTPFWITVVFAVYVASLLAALLTVGGLSDYVGRRPAILAALLLNAAAMLLFAEARDVGQLILARAVQGLCVGIGTTAFGAAILDTSRARGPLLNSVTAFLGLMAGSLGATALIAFAPDPLHRVYQVLLGLTVLMIALLWAMALGGLYLSLMPSVVATAMGVASPWVGGVVVSALMLTAAIAVAAFRDWPSRRLILSGTATLSLGVAVSMLGIQQQQVAGLLAGTIIAGAGVGSTFSGTLRALLPTAEPHQRAGLLAAFYLQSYLAFSLPAVAAGLAAPRIGLATAAYVYGAVVIGLTVISLLASFRSDR
jgi:hypothetical protein